MNISPIDPIFYFYYLTVTIISFAIYNKYNEPDAWASYSHRYGHIFSTIFVVSGVFVIIFLSLLIVCTFLFHKLDFIFGKFLMSIAIGIFHFVIFSKIVKYLGDE